MGPLFRFLDRSPCPAPGSRRWIGLRLFAILTLAALLSAQNELEQGLAAYKSGDYATALREFRIAAEAGEPTAMFSLGFMYLRGEGVAEDPKEAAHWLGLAAERGIAPAQHSLALLYYEGRGVEKNSTVAANYFESAALQGLGDAQYNLGVLYSHGDGVRQDWALAQFWHRKAAEQGVTDAQVALGVMAAKGQGVPRDYQEAARWFGQAATSGNQRAQRILETAFDEHPAPEARKPAPDTSEAEETPSVPANPTSPSPPPSESSEPEDTEKPFWENVPPVLSEQAFRDLQGRAVTGEPEALVALAWQYLHGVSTQANLVRSYVWAVTAERRGSRDGARLARAVYARMNETQRAAARAVLAGRD